MGFVRDFAAAATLGLTPTTKLKEAEAKYESRRREHERSVSSYNELQAQVVSIAEAMDAHFAEGKRILLSTGALTANVNNDVVCG